MVRKMLQLAPMPARAAWNHIGVRTGFEVLFVEVHGERHCLRGHTTAREDQSLWTVGYEVEVDVQWRTQTVQAMNSTAKGVRILSLERVDGHRWIVDGVRRPELDGCEDVDFESSAVTNTLPVHRIPFVADETVEVPAVFVRADDLRVERLDQRYTLTDTSEQNLVFHYESPTFNFECELTYDLAGLVTNYPGIATRDQ